MIGLMSAMPQEINLLVEELKTKQVTHSGSRYFHSGALWGIPTILAFSGWGKVAAATTATHLISKFEVDEILFTGVAGAADPEIRIGDIIIGTQLVQHDMDARPIFPRFQIPLSGLTFIRSDSERASQLVLAAGHFLNGAFKSSISEASKKEFFVSQPRVFQGQIATGDRFFAAKTDLEKLKSELPNLLCVEMEGAAVAQVCNDYQVPFSIVRTISDSADEGAPINFPKFVNSIASIYSREIIRELFRSNYTEPGFKSSGQRL